MHSTSWQECHNIWHIVEHTEPKPLDHYKFNRQCLLINLEADMLC